MKFSWKVLESILREGKAQREHISWKLRNFKMTESPEDIERLSKGWRKTVVPTENTWLMCFLSPKEEQTFSQAIPPLPFLHIALCQPLLLPGSSEKLLTVTNSVGTFSSMSSFWELRQKGGPHHSLCLGVRDKRDSRDQVRRMDYVFQHPAAGIRWPLGSHRLWNLLWEHYGPQSCEKLLQTLHPSLSSHWLTARVENKEKKTAARLRE